MKNGELLDAAEEAAFEVFVTTDSKLEYHQNLTARRVAIVVLGTPSWPRIERVVLDVIRAIDAASAGSYVEIAVP